MATRSVIGYIQEDGSFLGVYAHYDGYPSHMGQKLLGMPPDDIKAIVTAGIMKGGVRAVNSSELSSVEYFHEHWPEARRTELPGGEEYTYILGTDGKLSCLDSGGEEIPQEQWPFA